MDVNRYHIIPRKQKGITTTWAVARVKNSRPPLRASKVFKNKIKAIRYAREHGKKNKISVYVHRTNGLIELIIEYAKKRDKNEG